jgi:2-polyprenyl-6-methoxyphenol hydroxylase-like FAD-dependent oxidoreductase
METFDVVQVGYGPVGQAMVALLGRRGHRVAAFERQARLYGLPRVGGVDHEIMRIVQSLGVADELEAHTYPARGFDFLSATGGTLVHLDWNRQGESGWHMRPVIYQPDLEDALDRAVRSQPTVEVNQGWEAVHLQQHGDHIELQVEQRDTGLTRRLRARYVVGADGASSFVRQAAAIDWVDLGYQSEELVIDYRQHDP